MPYYQVLALAGHGRRKDWLREVLATRNDCQCPQSGLRASCGHHTRRAAIGSLVPDQTLRKPRSFRAGHSERKLSTQRQTQHTLRCGVPTVKDTLPARPRIFRRESLHLQRSPSLSCLSEDADRNVSQARREDGHSEVRLTQAGPDDGLIIPAPLPGRERQRPGRPATLT